MHCDESLYRPNGHLVAAVRGHLPSSLVSTGLTLQRILQVAPFGLIIFGCVKIGGALGTLHFPTPFASVVLPQALALRVCLRNRSLRSFPLSEYSEAQVFHIEWGISISARGTSEM
jgi:hypothetical protein